MSDTNWLTGAAASPYLPIVAGIVRGIVGIASGIGFTWALTVSADQITMAATAAVALGMLVWSGWQKIAAIRASRRSEVASAVASAELRRPVTVTETPSGHENRAVLIAPAEVAAAPSVPLDVAPSPAPRPAA